MLSTAHQAGGRRKRNQSPFQIKKRKKKKGEKKRKKKKTKRNRAKKMKTLKYKAAFKNCNTYMLSPIGV